MWYNNYMMTKQDYEDKETLIARVIALSLEDGHFTDSKHEITLDERTSDIKVRDLQTGFLVAYSSTKADFENSLVEFATDYFA
jgi:hypothetical protein